MTNAPLLSRLAEAKEGSRALSDEVLLTLGQLSKSHKLMPDRPDPTRNLQDAINLVPDEWPEGRLSWPGRDSGYLKANARAELHHMVSSGGGPRVISFAATRALALVICILKAMETGDG